MGTLTVTLPDQLESELEERVDDTEFESLEEYVLFIWVKSQGRAEPGRRAVISKRQASKSG